MQIEEGKFYRTRDGREVGPMEYRDGCAPHIWGATFEGGAQLWDRTGSIFSGDYTTDLIAEWQDGPATPQIWADMPREEKGALLLAHHEGKAIEFWHNGVCEWRKTAGKPFWDANTQYRVRPEPKRDTMTIYGYVPRQPWKTVSSEFDTHRITFDTIDGEPDCSSIRMERIKGAD